MIGLNEHSLTLQRGRGDRSEPVGHPAYSGADAAARRTEGYSIKRNITLTFFSFFFNVKKRAIKRFK